jgi:hypothetical protein
MATTKVRGELVDLNSATSDKGLKMPSGNVTNRPTEVLGQIRNNTSESILNSDSCMEYYNGTSWQAINLNEKPPYSADWLVIAGGATGGGSYGGGGGAGGLRTSYGSTSGGGGAAESQITLNTGTVYTATVGAGGANGNSNGNHSNITGAKLSTLESYGGGRGGGFNPPTTSGTNGGSGGGGFRVYSGCSGGDSRQVNGQPLPAPQGYNGGNSSCGNFGEQGGGGGAAGVGQNGQGSPTKSGDGGPGLAVSITGSSVAYAGGGGGGGRNPNTTYGFNGVGGIGGGGDGSYVTGTGGLGSPGTANTGGGGGGGGETSSGTGGNGGSGVIIIRIPTNRYTGTVTGSPTITTDGSDTIITFTGTGTYTA